MNVRFWIQPGTVAAVSRHGWQFEPYTTKDNLIFEQPAEETDDAMIFQRGTWRIRVARADVRRYVWDGSRGHYRPCL